MDRHLTPFQKDMVYGTRDAFYNQAEEHNRMTPQEAQIRLQLDPYGALRTTPISGNPKDYRSIKHYSEILSLDPELQRQAEEAYFKYNRNFEPGDTSVAAAYNQLMGIRGSQTQHLNNGFHVYNLLDAVKHFAELDNEYDRLNALKAEQEQNDADALANDLHAAQEYARYMNSKKK